MFFASFMVALRILPVFGKPPSAAPFTQHYTTKEKDGGNTIVPGLRRSVDRRYPGRVPSGTAHNEIDGYCRKPGSVEEADCLTLAEPLVRRRGGLRLRAPGYL